MKNLQRHLGAMLVIAGVVLAFGGKEQKERRQDHSLHEASAESTALNGGAVFKFGRTLSIGILIFPGWEPLDVIGPFELIQGLSWNNKMTLSVISDKLGPVTSRAPPHTMIPNTPLFDFSHMVDVSLEATHTPLGAPALDILLVPGGMGNMHLVEFKKTWMEDFVAQRYPSLEYLLSVCTGSVTLALSGVLKGKKATTNKASWAWVTQFGKDVKWEPNARWTVDGNIWTSSGVAAGMDMTYAFLKHLYGNETINPHMNQIEYAPHTDPRWDPFAVVHKVPGANKDRKLVDCTGPVGFV